MVTNDLDGVATECKPLMPAIMNTDRPAQKSDDLPDAAV